MSDELERRLRRWAGQSRSGPMADIELSAVHRVEADVVHDGSTDGVRSGAATLDRQVVAKADGLMVVVDVSRHDKGDLCVSGQVVGADCASIQAVDVDEVEVALTVADEFGQFELMVSTDAVLLIVCEGEREVVVRLSAD